MKAKADENAQGFLNDLAQRISRLEAELPQAQRQVIDVALSHPSTGLLIHKAFISASTTDVSERHKILAELIAKRLTAEADDTVTLAGNVAVDVIGAVSPRQIRLLGVLATLFGLRPANVAQVAQNQEEYDTFAVSWWDANLGRLLDPSMLEVRHIDFGHLVGLGCISLGSLGSYNPLEVFTIEPKPTPGTRITMARMESVEWWPTFQHLWSKGADKAKPTSIGSLIGTLYHDEVLQGMTRFTWDADRATRR